MISFPICSVSALLLLSHLPPVGEVSVPKLSKVSSSYLPRLPLFELLDPYLNRQPNIIFYSLLLSSIFIRVTTGKNSSHPVNFFHQFKNKCTSLEQFPVNKLPHSPAVSMRLHFKWPPTLQFGCDLSHVMAAIQMCLICG